MIGPIPEKEGGLYVHFPFCARLCPYCDFAVFVRREIPHDAYTDALIAELTRSERRETFDSIYLGGGTPSLWEPTSLRRFIDAVERELNLDVEEFTLEANPNDIDEESLQTWSGLGITRLSIGAQSFDDAYLLSLGRTHDGANAREAVQQALEHGFDVSLDLIYGGPAHRSEVLDRDLDQIKALRPHHVSAYELTIEPNTVFYQRQIKGTFRPASEKRRHALGVQLVEKLSEMGYQRYEVSSFARDREWSKHNVGYWTGALYLGLGVGAHSLIPTDEGEWARVANARDLKRYLSDPTGIGPQSERLTAPERWFERCFLASRTLFSWSLIDLTRSIAVSSELFEATKTALSTCIDRGWINLVDDRYETTAIGLDFADEIALLLLDAIEN